jgi:hypothetical protein
MKSEEIEDHEEKLKSKNGIHSPRSQENDDKKTEPDDLEHIPKLPRFNSEIEKINIDKFRLPEEEKGQFEMINGVFKIDFTNDPVVRSLLEAKQNRCDLFLQNIYLSRK